jgi:NAD-dependent deacetylase
VATSASPPGRSRVHALITQNVDGFHKRASSRAPINLHGTLRRVRCQGCADKRDAKTFLGPDGTTCLRCGGRMLPTVVLPTARRRRSTVSRT